ncbi:MAG: OmpH family outer membrane protein [Bacteroidetes bacterium]|nr:OmpH family outer membrane protein [Bacteroidota bacterium]
MKKLVYILVVLNICVLIFLAINYFSAGQKKIGIIKMDKVVYDFQGMKEATKKYEAKISEWKSETDSLQKILNSLYGDLKADSISKNEPKLKKDFNLFVYYRNAYYQLNQNIELKSKEMDKDMTSAVITQLNTYMVDFAKENSFDLIFCNNPQYPSVGYNKEENDITKTFLEYADKKYNGAIK